MTQIWDCTDARLSLGVYVLGAIDPAERALVDAHLVTCRDCRDELAGLAGLPALLARVNPDEISRIRADDTVRAGSYAGADDRPPGELIGTVLDEGGSTYNAILLADGGRVIGKTLKRELPNYGTFDEKRVFVPGPMPGPILTIAEAKMSATELRKGILELPQETAESAALMRRAASSSASASSATAVTPPTRSAWADTDTGPPASSRWPPRRSR